MQGVVGAPASGSVSTGPQGAAPLLTQAAEDPAALREQIYRQLKRSGVVKSLKVSP